MKVNSDVQELSVSIQTGSAYVCAEAMYEAGERRLVLLSGSIHSRATVDMHASVRREGIWALGKLRFQPALELAWTWSRADDRKLQVAAVWAIGNIGGKRAEWMLQELRTLLDQDDAQMQQIIGGGIKKCRGSSVRTSRRQMARRLTAPVSSNPRVRLLVERLSTLNIGSDYAEIVRVRGELASLDHLYFEQYMKSIREVENWADRMDDPKRFF